MTLPATTTGATHVNVYLSRTNGGVPLLLSSVAVGTATYTATALATGRRLPAGFEMPLPRERCSLTMPGCAVFREHGLSRAAISPWILPGLDSFLPFPAPVSIAISGQNGIYVVADKTYWIPDEGRWRMSFLRRRFGDGVQPAKLFGGRWFRC